MHLLTSETSLNMPNKSAEVTPLSRAVSILTDSLLILFLPGPKLSTKNWIQGNSKGKSCRYSKTMPIDVSMV